MPLLADITPVNFSRKTILAQARCSAVLHPRGSLAAIVNPAGDARLAENAYTLSASIKGNLFVTLNFVEIAGRPLVLCQG